MKNKTTALFFTMLLTVLMCTGAFTPVHGGSEDTKPAPTNTTVKFDAKAFGGFKARMIGPAVMSGRISAIAVVNENTNKVYVGTAGGGVWKSTDSCTTFSQVFEKHTMSIGALAVDQNHPDTVWVGTGECNVRNSVSLGNGVFVTTDGGKNWENKGLQDSERISKIILHPTEPDTLYVAAMGHLWNGNQERGVFKSTDAGKSWTKVLYVDEETGCADLEIDPQEPDVLYASMWQFRRSAYSFNSGGKGSGFYKSIDGGKNWKMIRNGFDKGNLGRIAIAVAPSRPGTLYALVEAEKNKLFRSDNMGDSWRMVNDTLAVGFRPFYFSCIEVDPQDHRRLYVPSLIVFASNNSGESFDLRTPGYHPDLHALWINPKNPDHFLLGTDGGMYQSLNRGGTYTQAASLPVSQFYHVSYDMETPYNVYGGLQDNGAWYAPSRSFAANGIQNHHWTTVGIGDGFYIQRHPKDEHIIYYTWQGGKLVRVNERTHESKAIQPMPLTKEEPRYRFNWNAAFLISPNDPETIYLGAQFLFRSRDRGDSWEKISPDLTSNDPRKLQQEKSGGLTIDNTTAENHCTIVSLSESPLNGSILWVGSDDGHIQVTRDGGKSWQNTVKNIPGLPSGTWCSSIVASAYAEGTALATFDGHYSGDMKSYVYKTEDFGNTWMSLSTDVLIGHCHVICQDPVNKDLLFLGTESGLFVSIDGGNQWAHLTNAVPQVAVRDLKIHPREHDLILATHGLGILIIDDISAFRDLTADLLNADAKVLNSRTAIMETPTTTQEFPGNSTFKGENPSGGAAVTYYLKKRHIFGKMNLEILAPDGKVIKTLPSSNNRGLNRIFWDMRLKRPKIAQAGGLDMRVETGPMVREGTYTVRLVKGKETYTGKITLVPNPVSAHNKEDRDLRYKTVLKLYEMQADLGFVGDNVKGLIDQIDRILKTDKSKRLTSDLEPYKKELESFHHSIVQHLGPMAGEKLRGDVMGLYSDVIQYGGKPSQSQLYYLSVLEARIKQAENQYQSLIKKRVRFDSPLKSKKLSPLVLMTREDYDKKL